MVEELRTHAVVGYDGLENMRFCRFEGRSVACTLGLV